MDILSVNNLNLNKRAPEMIWFRSWTDIVSICLVVAVQRFHQVQVPVLSTYYKGSCWIFVCKYNIWTSHHIDGLTD